MTKVILASASPARLQLLKSAGIFAEVKVSGINEELPEFLNLPPSQMVVALAKAKALAVASNKRLATIPDVPTAAEVGLKGYESAAWFALIAPKNTPKNIVDKLNKDVNQALADPTVRTKFSELGAEPMIGPPEDLNNLMASDIKKWTAIIKKGGITLEK